MSGVRKTSGAGIIPLEPDAISRTIQAGVRRMERDPRYQRTLTLHPRRPAQPPVLRCSELGRRARIFGTARQALHCQGPLHGRASATQGRRPPVLRQPSVVLTYESGPNGRVPRMIPLFESRQAVLQALRRGEITANSMIRLQQGPHQYYDCRVYQLGLHRGTAVRSTH